MAIEWRERGKLKWLQAEMPGATAVFSTRVGGVSEPPFDGLNLGILTDDDRGSVLQNRHIFTDTMGVSAHEVLMGLQVHGAEMLSHNGTQDPSPYATGTGELPEVDGHLTAIEGPAPFVLVADCLPVALSGPGGVAMLHCGWRGLAAGIIEKAVPQIGATAAAIGPGIGPCCFEVGPEVSDQFRHLGDGLLDGRLLDLPEVARRLLDAAGISDVQSTSHCTYCDADLFFSHRRDNGRTGRQGGLVWRPRQV